MIKVSIMAGLINPISVPSNLQVSVENVNEAGSVNRSSGDIAIGRDYFNSASVEGRQLQKDAMLLAIDQSGKQLGKLSVEIKTAQQEFLKAHGDKHTQVIDPAKLKQNLERSVAEYTSANGMDKEKADLYSKNVFTQVGNMTTFLTKSTKVSESYNIKGLNAFSSQAGNVGERIHPDHPQAIWNKDSYMSFMDFKNITPK
jgi:succinate dehydrogenase/fumarate reductase flavoprotein subunit